MLQETGRGWGGAGVADGRMGAERRANPYRHEAPAGLESGIRLACFLLSLFSGGSASRTLRVAAIARLADPGLQQTVPDPGT